MDISSSLMYYKRREVQQAIVREATDKECSVRYIDGAFGKRPDSLRYENDILQFAKNKATSFHCSEELWFNPLALTTNMKRVELDSLRKGWDLILDIDCPNWKLSKVTSHLFVRALEDHGIKNVFCKFSGNKGFHIAVAFESFPEKINYNGSLVEFKNLFPEGARKIAVYLLSYITEKYAKVVDNGVLFLDKHFFSFEELDELAKKSTHSLTAYRCTKCKAVFANIPNKNKMMYVCSKCATTMKPIGKPEVIRCTTCSFPVEPSIQKEVCTNCFENSSFEKMFNFFAVVDVDTILIASRHLYRMPYSLHETTNLVSIPIDSKKILLFEKDLAKPEIIAFNKLFIDRSKTIKDEAVNLILAAFDFTFTQNEKNSQDNVQKEIVIPETALSEEYFPPCVKNILKGLEDGKKRALFILLNFLQTSGWNYESIKKLVYEWNEKNTEPLREQYLKGQLSQLKKGKKIVLPPSCSNKEYYRSISVCEPNEFCNFVKNPTQYGRNLFELKKTKKIKPKEIKNNESDSQKKYIVVDADDNVLLTSSEFNNENIYRKSLLVIRNSGDGVLLAKFKSTNKWDITINVFNFEKNTYESSIKKLAKENLGLKTFVLRESLMIHPSTTKNYFQKWFVSLVDRHINKFNPNTSILELKWFSISELDRKIQESPLEFTDEVIFLIKNLKSF